MIKKYEVKTYIERFYCNRCGTEMKCKSVVDHIGSSPTFIYECPSCGDQSTASECYPKEIRVEGQ